MRYEAYKNVAKRLAQANFNFKITLRLLLTNYKDLAAIKC
jgi:hypothetical protein